MHGGNQGQDTQRPRWSVVMAYYNEADGILPTLAALAAQTTLARLILVDNASTDGGEEVCRRFFADRPEADVTYLREPKPGQSQALKAGLAAVETVFVAIADADTVYPPHYLATAGAMFDADTGLVAAMACLVPSAEPGWDMTLAKLHWMGAALIWPYQNHTSGPAQTFRTAALRAAGGYDPDIWPYVLKDHELMARVLRVGRQAYHRDLWCVSSDRRKDRSLVRWTLYERLVYHLHPSLWRDWFFHDFLAPRFAKRGLTDKVLRDRPWEAVSASPVARLGAAPGMQSTSPGSHADSVAGASASALPSAESH